jgi:hypothetical protein
LTSAAAFGPLFVGDREAPCNLAR